MNEFHARWRPARRAAFLMLLALSPAAALAAGGGVESRECVISPHTEVEVSAALPGLLEAVHIERSDTVHRGEVLARLESAVERASVELADAWASIDSEIEQQVVSQGLDGRRRERVSRLYRSQAVALDDKDQAETDARLAGIRLRQAREKRWVRSLEAAKARAALERRSVRSPIDGVVVERFRTAGEYVENQPIARIAQLDPLKVETILPMTEFGTVRVGMLARVRSEHSPEEAFTATVAVVDRMGDAASGTFGVRLTLPNPGGRIPAGLRCTLEMLAGAAASAPAPDGSHEPAAPPVETFESPARDAAPALQARAPAAPDAPPTPVAEDAPGPGVVSAAVEAPPARRLDIGVVSPAYTAAVAEEPPTCGRVGPFHDRSAALAAADRLGTGDAASRVRRGRVTVPNGFIVVSTYQPDRAELRALAARMRAAGIQDLALMGRGEFSGRVALGVYDGEGVAGRRASGVQARGFEAEVLPRTRSAEGWWVDAVRRGGGALTPGPLPRGAGVTEVPCNGAGDLTERLAAAS